MRKKPSEGYGHVPYYFFTLSLICDKSMNFGDGIFYFINRLTHFSIFNFFLLPLSVSPPILEHARERFVRWLENK